MASALHDVIEDSNLSIDDLVEAGYTVDVARVIDCLAHRGDETYEEYIDRVAGNDVARRVKIADVNENLANNVGYRAVQPTPNESGARAAPLGGPRTTPWVADLDSAPTGVLKR